MDNNETLTKAVENNEETTFENVGGNTVSGYTFYDEFGNIITLEIADNSEEIELLTSQLEQLQALNENQAGVLETLTGCNEQQELALQAMAEQNARLEEINKYSAYTFAILLAFILYRILSGALSAMFGGG